VRAVARRVHFIWRIRASGTDYYAALTRRRDTLTVRFFDTDFQRLACQDLTGGLDRATRVATVTVPPSCFESPAHVRVGLWSAVVRGKRYVYFDDALRLAFDPDRAQVPKLSQRLDRI
jgi:hypothetical protein